jgi:hypothetical protein
MSKQGNHMEVMVPTWRYDHSPFPLTTMVSAGLGQLGSLEVATGLKYSLDIRIGEDMEGWTVDKLVKDAFETQAFQQSWSKIAYLTPKSRRSNGNQGKHDSIEATHNDCNDSIDSIDSNDSMTALSTHSHHSQAWDIEFLQSSIEEANLAACEFWELLKDMRPMLGSCNMLNWDGTCMFLF